MVGEVCGNCGKVHTTGERIDVTRAEAIDVDSLQLVMNKVSCASQSARPDAIPDGIDPEKAKIFIQAAIDSLANYRWLEKDIWDRIIEKYDLPRDKNIFLDFHSKMFYFLG